LNLRGAQHLGGDDELDARTIQRATQRAFLLINALPARAVDAFGLAPPNEGDQIRGGPTRRVQKAAAIVVEKRADGVRGVAAIGTDDSRVTAT
jgi:hypothetical protein